MNDPHVWLNEIEKELNSKETHIVEMSVVLSSSVGEDRHKIIFQGRTKDGVFSELSYDVNCELFVAVFGKLNEINSILTWAKQMDEEQ